jgi:hypothetical protein
VELNLEERYALEQFFASEYLPLRTAIEKFTAHQQSVFESESAGHMRTIPRDPERASDSASKADAYENFMRELERFSAKHPA